MTSDRDALYRAILANPDDDTPRLVFADYLEEDGEAEYAAFIRRQIELARLPEWDPVRLRAEHLDREETLGDKWYSTKWYNAAFPQSLSWSGGPFRRGFPASLEVRDLATFLSHAPDIFRAYPVEELNVWGDSSRLNDPFSVHSLAESPWLSRIRHLSFSLAPLDQDGIEQIRDSPHAVNLTGLDVMTGLHTQGNPAGWFRGQLLGHLERLAIHIPEDHSLDALTAIQKVRSPQRLRNLRLSSGRNHGQPILLCNSEFFSAPLLQELTDLDLSHNWLASGGLSHLLDAPFLGRLQSLRLNWCRLGTTSLRLAESTRLERLQMLDLAKNEMGIKEIQTLAKSPLLAKLRVLNLETNPIDDAGAIALAKSPHLKNLLVLNLMFCGVGQRGVEALFDSPLADNLVHLHVFSPVNTITPAMKRKLRKRFGNRVNV